MATNKNTLDDNWQNLPYYSNLYFNWPITDEWVGAGDLIDYRRILPDYAGKYDFVLSGIDKSAALTLSIWQKSGNKLKLVKKVTSKNQSSVSINDLLIDMDNEYFVSVETKGGKSVKASGYNLTMSGEEFQNANREDDTWTALTSEYEITVDRSVSGEWLGFGDTVDYRKLALAYSGMYDFSLTGLDKAAQIVLTVWQVDGSKLKAVKTLTVKGKTSGELTDLLLDAQNTYYVSVELKNAAQGAATGYSLSCSGEQFAFANNADDNFAALDETYLLKVGDSTGDEWVGFGDTVDYRKIALNYAGNYALTLSGIDKSVPITLTLWKLDGEKLKSVKSITVKGKTAGGLSDLLLTADGDYYVSVEVKNANRGLSTFYELSLSGTEYSKADNSDDSYLTPNWQSLTFQGLITDEWVGFGDTVDYRQIEISRSGCFDFTLQDLDKSAQLTMTVYELKNDKLKSVKSLSLKGKTEGTLAGVELTAGNSYYLAVEAKGNSSSDYTLAMGGEEFAGNNEDDKWQTLPEAYQLADGEQVTDEWVGLHDLIDYRKLNLATTGLYRFALVGADADAQLALTIWQQNGTKLKSVKTLTVKNGKEGAISGLKLNASEQYFVSVQIKNASAKKCAGTDYTLAMNLEQEILADNSDDTWAKASKLNRFADTDNLAEWLGKGDSTDWFKLNITESKHYDWNFDLGEELEATLYKVNGKKLTAIEGNSGNLSAGTYALEIAMASPTEDGVRYNLYFVPSNSYIEASLATVF